MTSLKRRGRSSSFDARNKLVDTRSFMSSADIAKNSAGSQIAMYRCSTAQLIAVTSMSKQRRYMHSDFN